MSGHVRLRGKVWYAVLRATDARTGKKKVVWRSLPGATGKRQAEIACAKLVTEVAGGTFVMNDATTFGQWVEHWISIGCPGSKNRRAVREKTAQRYGELLAHVLPALGHRPLGKLRSEEIDALYSQLVSTLSPGTMSHAHVVLSSCLATATRTRKIANNPMAHLTVLPKREEADHGVALEPDELRKLLEGLKGSPLYAIAATAAFTGSRRGELLALRWDDFNPIERTLRIERSVEQIGRRLEVKPPKTARGVRTIEIDPDLCALLMAEYDRQRRIIAGVPDGVSVDLRMVRLPADALIFPAPPAPGEDISLTKLRNPQSMTETFARAAARIGFGHVRFHDLRGTHETMLLDAGTPVHVVAARCGHDPAVLLRSYAKRTKKADTSAAAVIGKISRGILGS